MESKKFHTLVARFEAWNVNVSEFITFLCSAPSLRNSLLVQDLHTNGAVISGIQKGERLPYARACNDNDILVAFQYSFDGFGLPKTWVVTEGGLSK